MTEITLSADKLVELLADAYGRSDLDSYEVGITEQVKMMKILKITVNPTTESFIRDWAKLEPNLGAIDLRAAIYLSRETMPIGAYVVGLSPAGREILAALVETKNTSSPTADSSLNKLPLEEQIPVMEGVINHLRQISDWSRKPKGFAGACLLARHSADAAKILARFLQELNLGHKSPPWMTAALKEEQWHKEY